MMVSSKGSLPLTCGNDKRSSVIFQIVWCRFLRAGRAGAGVDGRG